MHYSSSDSSFSRDYFKTAKLTDMFFQLVLCSLIFLSVLLLTFSNASFAKSIFSEVDAEVESKTSKQSSQASQTAKKQATKEKAEKKATKEVEKNPDTKKDNEVTEKPKTLIFDNTTPSLQFRSGDSSYFQPGQSGGHENTKPVSEKSQPQDNFFVRHFKSLDFNKPLYLGAGISRSETALLNGSKGQGDVTVRLSSDEQAVSYWLMLGMNYNKNLDLELRYQDFGNLSQKIVVIDASEQIQSTTDVDLAYQSLGLFARPNLELGAIFQVNAELGLAYFNAKRNPKVSIQGGQDPESLEELRESLDSRLNDPSASALSLSYGLGLELKPKASYSLRYDWSHSSSDEEDLSSHVLSFTWNFRKD